MFKSFYMNFCNLASQSYIDCLKEWQDFGGAIIAVIVSVLLSLGLQSYFKNKQDLKDLYKYVSTAVYELLSTKKDLEFFQDRIKDTESVLEKNPVGYFISRVNFPSMRLEYGDKFIDMQLKSNFLMNKLAQCHLLLKDINYQLQDLQFEFRDGLKENHERILASNDLKLTSEQQHILLKDHISNIKRAVDDILIKGNIPLLISEFLLVRKYLKRYYFSPTFVTLWYEAFRDKDKNFLRLHEKFENEAKLDIENAVKFSKEKWKKFSSNVADFK